MNAVASTRESSSPARAGLVLTTLLNIDPQAVAVVNGQVVPEDTVIQEHTNLLSFVKPSAIKG